MKKGGKVLLILLALFYFLMFGVYAWDIIECWGRANLAWVAIGPIFIKMIVFAIMAFSKNPRVKKLWWLILVVFLCQIYVWWVPLAGQFG